MHFHRSLHADYNYTSDVHSAPASRRRAAPVLALRPHLVRDRLAHSPGLPISGRRDNCRLTGAPVPEHPGRENTQAASSEPRRASRERRRASSALRENAELEYSWRIALKVSVLILCTGTQNECQVAKVVPLGTAPSTWGREEPVFILVDRTSYQFLDISLPGNVRNHQLHPTPAIANGPFFAPIR